jgi:hypothetical protein
MARAVGTVSDEAPAGSPLRAVLTTGGIVLAGTGAAVAGFFFAFHYLRVHHAPTLAFGLMTLAYGVVVLGVALTAAAAGRRQMGGQQSAAMKRYTRRFSLVMVLYVAVLLAVLWTWAVMRPSGIWAVLLAVAPAVPLTGAITVLGLYLREETDEFQRAVFAEAALWATGGMLAVANVWGFLEMFRIVPYVPAWAAFVVWAVFFGPGQIIARRRYQ